MLFSRRRKSTKLFRTFYLGAISLFFVIAALVLVFNPVNPDIAKAQSGNNPTIDLFPGQIITVSVYYDNANKNADFNGLAQLKLQFDERLEYISGTLKDSYNASGQKCINDTVGGGILSTQAVAGGKTITQVEYTPRTATTNPVNGSCQSGNGAKGLTQSVTLPKATASFNPNDQTTWRGRLEFRVKLKENVLQNPYNLNLGDVITVNEGAGDFGLQHEFQMSDTVIGGAAYNIRIAGQSLDVDLTIRDGECFNQPVVIGSPAICQFPLNGSTEAFIFPSDFRVTVDTAIQGAASGSCSIVDSNRLRCEVPTTGADSGVRDVVITSAGKQRNRAQVTLTRQFIADQDDDQDGLFNGYECGNNTGRNCLDTDQDSVQDYRDTDSDADGIPDFIEKTCTEGVGQGNPCDTDGDETPDYIDLDSDQDGVLDESERGDYTCDFNQLPPLCENQLADSNSNNIPAYRDSTEQVGLADEDSFLIPREFISFGSLSGNYPTFKRDTVVLKVQFERNILNCSMSYRKADSKENWIPMKTRVANNNCSGTINATNQDSNQLEFNIDIRDENSTRWGAYPSYRLEVGSLGITIPKIVPQRQALDS
jgi:hypothetical protein